MARKPSPRLPVVREPTPAPQSPQPPPDLGERALALWHQVTSHYEFDDPASIETLRQAVELVYRAERLRAAILVDGEVVRARGGVVRAHPALATELQARSLACR